MCSPRELALPNAPQKRGIIELDDTALVGEAFNPEKTLERVGKRAWEKFLVKKNRDSRICESLFLIYVLYLMLVEGKVLQESDIFVRFLVSHS